MFLSVDISRNRLGASLEKPQIALIFLQKPYSKSKIWPNPPNHHTVIDPLKYNLRPKGHCFLGIKRILLVDELFIGGHIQIHFETCLTEIGYSVMKS